MARILVLGAGGQLGTALQRVRTPSSWTIVPAGRDVIDLADLERLPTAIEAARPDAIINAAGHTAVDRAETEAALAFVLNRDAPALLAATAARLGAPLVHVSTDYVFGGDKATPYVESDPRNPISVYGRSKAEGEIAVLDAGARAAIVRTSWVFSTHGANFLKTMLKLGQTRDEVGVVSDQRGRPTDTDDLARACVLLSQRLLEGEAAAADIFHFAGDGETTWADFAEAIFAEASARGRPKVRVRPILTAEYPTPARRPANSRLDTSKIEAFGIAPRPWREGMRACLDELLA